MARIVGPMHSDDARGLYGGISNGVVYSAWRRFRYTRTRVTSENPRTIKQHGKRARLRVCNAIWKAFTDPEKAYWTDYGTPLGLPGWQAFVRYNMLTQSDGWGAQLQVNTQHLGVPAPPTSLAASVVDNVIVATWTDGTLSYTSGLHLGIDAGFTPAMSNVVYETPATDGEDRQATIRIAPGTYYIKARSTDEDGGVGAPSDSVGPLIIN